MSSHHRQSPAGLRERKKAKTRAAIQQHALRLFAEQGYDATSVEQIAQAAEVSPSTFFRYFPTKESVVTTDEYDDLLAEAILAQPAEMSPIAAVRAAMGLVFSSISADELSAIRERALLAFSVTSLRAASLENLLQTMGVLAEAIAQRTHRDTHDLVVRTIAGALLGVSIAAAYDWFEHPEVDMAASLDAALALLEAGLPV